MKLAILLLAVIASGCASSYRVNPSLVGVALNRPTQPCSQVIQDIPVVLDIANNSRGLLKIGVWTEKGPPYKINWTNYDVLDDSGEIDWKHGPGGHGPVPSSTLVIGPGDSTSVYANVYEVTASDHSRKFKIQFEDLDDHRYITESFLPCVSPRASN